MKINISKADYANLINLTDKVYGVIRNKKPSVSEYNTARLLRQTVRKIERINKNNKE